MPIYEYICEACEHTLDALQKISDTALTDCPSCGESSLKKKLSAPGFRLSGSGWYETDFKRDNRRNLADGGAGLEIGDRRGEASAHSGLGEGMLRRNEPEAAIEQLDRAGQIETDDPAELAERARLGCPASLRALIEPNLVFVDGGHLGPGPTIEDGDIGTQPLADSRSIDGGVAASHHDGHHVPQFAFRAR